MITPFGLRHIGLVQALQGASVTLDPKSALLEEPSIPLRSALRGYFLRSSGTFTYVLQAADQGTVWRGFAQCQASKSGAGWQIVRMAPALGSSAEAATVWYRLLLHLCIAAGERRVQRLFACLPQDGPPEEVFRQAGFALYAHELLWECKCAGNAGHQPSGRVRPAQPEDRWEVLRFYHRATPRSVVQAEEPNGGPQDHLPFAMPGLNAQQGYVLPGAKGELDGYLHIATGARGSWLRLLVQSNGHDAAAEMLDHALAVLGGGAGLPVYCAVREYEGGIRALLAERGFAFLGVCSLLVKHTTVQVKESQRKLVPALEKRAGVASPVSHSESGIGRNG